uniref:Uncharacterized protein n=1 Tax=Ditylenchus dipsaci TaxID=166011 RepID=A0A915CRQ7_9BILA
MRYFLHPLTVVAINAAAILFAFGLALLTYHSLTPPQEFPKVVANYPEILEKLFNGSVFIRLKLNDFAILYVIAIGLFIQQIFTISACYGIFKTLNQNPYFFSKRTYVMHKQLTIIFNSSVIYSNYICGCSGFY